MAYCTEASLRALIDGYEHLLRDSENDFSTQIGMAEAWINAYLEAAGVEAPLSVAPAFVALACANYAAYLITNRPDSTGAFADYAMRFKAEAEKLLGDYLNGKAEIPGSNALPKVYGAIPTAVNPGAS